MNNQSRFEYLLEKYIQDNYTSEEFDELLSLTNLVDIDRIDTDILLNATASLPADQLDKHQLNDVFNRIQKLTKAPRFYPLLYKVAAAILLLITFSGLIYTLNSEIFLQSGYKDGALVIADQNGKQLIIDETKVLPIISGSDTIGYNHGNKIEYTQEPSVKVFNTIQVPYGKKAELTLADGSHIYLNSGSSLRYPLNFSLSKERIVELNGEAFFEVARNEKKPFMVKSGDLNVKVLGTKFNVNSYAEKAHINVVLTEGSVGLYTSNDQKPQLLAPSQIASYEISSQSIQIDKINTDDYTAWINNRLIYKSETLKGIFSDLERQFNVKISSSREDFSQQAVNANFGNDSLENIIKYLSKVYGFEFEIDEKSVEIR